ncbi:MAG: heme ABC exporter ATP-binding protein CcmA [Dehalococcoidia bacterium]
MARSTDSPAVQVEGLQKSFGDWPVLWDLDLTVGWGEFLVLFGANGAGKTTLLRILSTQVRAEAGTVRIAGYDQRRQSQAVRRQVGVVAHSSFLYDDLTCRENLIFYGRLYRISDLTQRVDEVLSLVNLVSRSQQRARTLSHGMQKRLAIARAILHRPSLLLLDEPESGLDRESVETLNHLLQEWTGAGRTVIMTTHNVELGLAWGSRVALLADGKLGFQEATNYLGLARARDLLTGPDAGPERVGEPQR